LLRQPWATRHQTTIAPTPSGDEDLKKTPTTQPAVAIVPQRAQTLDQAIALAKATKKESIGIDRRLVLLLHQI